MSDGPNDFEIGNKISDLLKDVVRERQQRILRWVAESVGVSLGPSSPGSAVVPDASRFAPSSQVSGRPIDIKTFVDSKNPRSDMQFAAVVAYYYRFEAPLDERVESISAEVLQDAARLASRARLTRPLTTLNNAKSQGYLDTVGRGLFRINSVGENLVAMALPATDPSTSSGSRLGRARTKKSGRKRSTSKSGGSKSKKVPPKTARR